MNPWDFIVVILGWGLMLLVVVIILVALAAMVVGTYSVFKPKPTVTLEAYLTEAAVIGMDLYKEEIEQEDLISAFRAGARWGWGFHHRK